jgi:hypothetical protein
VASSSSSSPLPPLPSYGPFIIQKNFLPMAFLSSKKLPSYGPFIIQKNFLPMAFLSSKKLTNPCSNFQLY